MKRKLFAGVLFTLLLMGACNAKLEAPQFLTIMTHDSFAISEELVAHFEEQYEVELVFLKLGDTGEAVNKAVLAANNPLADVFFGVDNTFLSRALDGEIFEAYESPLLAEIPDEFKLDNEFRALPIDFGDVCLNYDIAYFEDVELMPPTDIDQLTSDDYSNLLVVENPATSSPGLAFLLTTISRYGEEGYLDYWLALRENGVRVVNDWESAYYAEFSRWGGEYPLVVSYSSSPAAEVIFADPPVEDAPTASVVGDQSCFRQIEFAGILAGTKQRELAENFIDFMLSDEFQEALPLNMFVFPVRENVDLPREFVDYAELAKNPAFVSPQEIAQNREKWIAAWTETVLR
jgi:thiamine transport system substrate-binding protein